ncbi:hypothetical protein BH11MYX4_BH11MYX4_69470 [soil metagenome]
MTMQMESALTFGFDLNDRLGARVWIAIMTCALARGDEGLVVCDADRGVLFATARAVDLLARLGMGPDHVLPEAVASLVSAQLATADAPRSGVLGDVQVHADVLRGLEGHTQVVLFVREEPRT